MTTNYTICTTCGRKVAPSWLSRHYAVTGHSFTGEADAPVDALVQAVIAREVAEDDYFASLFAEAEAYGNTFRANVSNRRRLTNLRFNAEKAMIDARMVAMLEADAAGLINLFDKLDTPTEERAAEIMRFSTASKAENMAVLHVIARDVR